MIHFPLKQYKNIKTEKIYIAKIKFGWRPKSMGQKKKKKKKKRILIVII